MGLIDKDKFPLTFIKIRVRHLTVAVHHNNHVILHPDSSTGMAALSSTGSILSNTDLSDLSTVGTCDIFVDEMRHRVM